MAIKSVEITEVVNEVEIFEFVVNDQSYGVNVLKIRQIIRFEREKLSKPPKAIPAMIGLIKILNRMVPIIDLNQAFYAKKIEKGQTIANMDRPDPVNQIIIVLEFNRSWFGFLVDRVEKIHRFNGEEIKGIESGLAIEYVNSTVSFQNRTIFILDFEFLVSSFFYDESYMKFKPSTPINNNSIATSKNILLVDDSKSMRDIIVNFLMQAGFKNIEMASNGKEGFDRYKNSFDEVTGVAKFDLIISDIEMPLSDGFSFCRKVKALKKNQFFMLLSSLASKQMLTQSQEVGADRLVSKRDMEKLHIIINEMFQ